MAASEPAHRPFLTDALHLFALCGFAIAQPLFATLSGSPEFFVAHRAGRPEIIVIAVAISVGLPLALICVEALLRPISRQAQHVFHVGAVSILLLVIAMQIVNRLPIQSTTVLLTLALAITASAATLYVRSASTRHAVTFLSFGALLFPLNFMLVSPISTIVLSQQANVTGVDASDASAPVIMIIFDEFNPTALLDRTGKIDAVRYPNFADLAHNAMWFPRSTSVHPHTQFAVPAILTGKMPNEANSAPTFNTYPRNLFSLLGGQYQFHVVESLTSLCPQSACRDREENVDYRSLISDLIVVFSYFITPQSIAKEVLPPLNEGWRAFGAASGTPAADIEQVLVKSFIKQANSSRVSAFKKFVAQIDSSDKKLHFLHILLPHQPYQFFPDGTAYQSIPDTRTGEWPQEQQVIAAGYHRYMTQLGLVDSLLGTLVAHLRDIGIFDRSLIVITGDHGRAFKAGHASRELDSQNIDLLHAPLFIKLPHQKEGITNTSLVSSLDILPTMIDALGVRTTWSLDGHPLTGKDIGAEKSVSVSARGERFELNREDITRSPLLGWQIETFGDGKTVADTSVATPYDSLIGKDVSSFTVEKGAGASAPALSQNIGDFDQVDIKSGFLPALFSSEIEGLNESGERWMAIALNGRVAAVTPVFKAADGDNSVLVLLPQKYFVDGKNRFRAFIIQDRGKQVALSPVRAASRSYRMESQNDSVIITSIEGKKYKLLKDRTFGYVDNIEVGRGSVNVAGWSADTRKKSTADIVIIFDGMRSICTFPAENPRPDVAKAFDAPELAASGFEAICPFARQSLNPDTVKFVGISRDGEAGLLYVPGKK